MINTKKMFFLKLTAVHPVSHLAELQTNPRNYYLMFLAKRMCCNAEGHLPKKCCANSVRKNQEELFPSLMTFYQARKKYDFQCTFANYNWTGCWVLTMNQGNNHHSVCSTIIVKFIKCLAPCFNCWIINWQFLGTINLASWKLFH